MYRENKTSQHILPTASTLLGFCLVVITSPHITSKIVSSSLHEIASVVSVILCFAVVLSFVSIKSGEANGRLNWNILPIFFSVPRCWAYLLSYSSISGYFAWNKSLTEVQQRSQKKMSCCRKKCSRKKIIVIKQPQVTRENRSYFSEPASRIFSGNSLISAVQCTEFVSNLYNFTKKIVAAKILLIDDELKLLKLLGMIISNEGYEVFRASSARSGMNMLTAQQIDLVLCDVRLPDGFGVDLVKEIKTKHPHIEIILMTAYGNIPDGVQAMRNGAYDYIVKGDDNEKILPLVSKALEKVKDNIRNGRAENSKDKINFSNIIGQSQSFLYSKMLAKKVAHTDTAVLLTGETGTGKEVFANAIHQESYRKKGNFLAINCSAFGKDVLESELFGHKKGAFTGALSDKKGLIEEARNGTLFLDEIGEMPLELQSKMLRVLENGEFIKMGDTKISHSNFRLIAATNRDLKEESRRGNFREDLYFRLNVFEILLPPLRERKEDIRELANYYIEKFSARMNLKAVHVAPDFYKRLEDNPWKGNIRELKNTLERSLILMENNQLSAENLPNSTSGNFFAMSAVEKEHILKVLKYTKGNKAEAARLLDIGIATLYRKLEEYHLK